MEENGSPAIYKILTHKGQRMTRENITWELAAQP